MGSAIAEAVTAHCPATLEMPGIQDRFGASGDYMAPLEKHGLTSANMEGRARAIVARGRR